MKTRFCEVEKSTQVILFFHPSMKGAPLVETRRKILPKSKLYYNYFTLFILL